MQTCRGTLFVRGAHRFRRKPHDDRPLRIEAGQAFYRDAGSEQENAFRSWIGWNGVPAGFS